MASQWGKADYDRSLKYIEQLKHTTLKGDFVRSKSEVIIANMLFSKGIPYHYEEIIQVGDHFYAPDFRIAVRGSNRFVILEHCGMMGNRDYESQFTRKLMGYIHAGYIPWRDVFFTFDEGDGMIDTMAISRMMDNYFL